MRQFCCFAVFVVGALVGCNNPPDYQQLLSGTWNISTLQLDEIPPQGSVEALEALAQKESVFQFRRNNSYQIKLGNGYVSGRWEVDQSSGLPLLRLHNEAGSTSEMLISAIGPDLLRLSSEFKYGSFRTGMHQELVRSKDKIDSFPKTR